MKELSIEEKAKAYDEAIEIARQIHDAYRVSGIELTTCEEIFPELKEREGERIRKRIIHALHGDILEMDELKDALAWLEKQGEQKPQRIVSAEAKEAMYDNPAWSEEDELKIDFISKLILGLDQEKYDSQCMKELADWLKSLKDRVQPQNRWKPSESDILLLERITNGMYNPQDFQASLCGLIGQLKKLMED